MIILIQVKETVDVAKDVLSTESVSVIGLMLLFILLLILDRRSLIKKYEECQEKVLQIMEHRLSDAKNHHNDSNKIREDFKEMVEQIHEVYRNHKTG